MEQVLNQALDAAEERILDTLLPPARTGNEAERRKFNSTNIPKKASRGELDNKEIEIDLKTSPIGVEIIGPLDGGND